MRSGGAGGQRARGGGGSGRLAPTTLLLIFPVALLALGLVQLALVRKQVVEWQTLTGAGLFALGLLLAAVWLRIRLPRADPLLLPLAAALAAVGPLMTSRPPPRPAAPARGFVCIA